jgi:competence protein ComGC
MRTNNSSRDRHRHGLTFLDVVIVLVLIAILVALWVPMVGRARERSRRQLCAQRLNMKRDQLLSPGQRRQRAAHALRPRRQARPD